jgi:hypothetical protein
MAWQIAKPLGLGEVQETSLLAEIPKGAQPLGQAAAPSTSRVAFRKMKKEIFFVHNFEKNIN